MLKVLDVIAEPLNGKAVNKSKASSPIGSRLWPLVLPMSTGVPILPNQTAQITGRPQCAFTPGRLVIEDAVGFIVNDIKIGTRSQLAQCGDIPGRMFAPDATDTFGGGFDTAPPGTDVVLIVTNVGKKQAVVSAAFLGRRGR